MSNTNATTPLIQPSQNDVNGGVSGDGKKALEKYLRELFKALNGISYFLPGFSALPTTAANLVLIVPAGEGYISGYYAKWGATNVTLPASSTSHIFVKLIFSGGLVTNIQIEDNVTGTHPADSIKYGTVVTSGSAITSSTDQRLLDGNQRIRRAVITAVGVNSWIVPANITRGRFRLWGSGGGGGGGAGDGAGYGQDGARGGYVEAVVALTPGSTVTITIGAGGLAGPGGATANDGSDGQAGAASSIVGTGFSFTANGGGFGLKGLTTGPRFLMPASRGTATQSVGTADVLNHGDGMANGVGGPGAVSSPGTAGTSGSNAVCVIDY